MRLIATAPIFAAVFTFTTLAPAQVPGGELVTLADQKGPRFNDYWGFVIANPGDVSGDGIPDYAFSAPLDGPHGLWEAGKIFVHSGADHSLLWTASGDAEDDALGTSLVAVGDVNADGIPDLLAGAIYADIVNARNVGMVRIYSGRDGAVLHTIYGNLKNGHLGAAAAPAGDINHDGHADVAVGRPDGNYGYRDVGRVLAFSGLDGSILFNVHGPDEGGFGASLAQVGDWNGNGTPDLLTGAPDAFVNGSYGVGCAYVLDGADGSVLHRWEGVNITDEFGATVAAVGDVNGDGASEAAVAATDFDADRGIVHIFSSVDGSLLVTLGPGLYGRERFGTSLAGGRDWDQDGVPDLIASSPFGQVPGSSYGDGWAIVFSGADWRILHLIEPRLTDGMRGQGISFIDDMDGDGAVEFAIGAPGAFNGAEMRAGSVEILHYDRYLIAGAQEVSVSTGGTAQFELRFPASQAGAPYRLVASLAGAGITNVGIDLPLIADSLTLDLADRRAPSRGSWQGFWGTLDGAARASATLAFAPGELPSGAVGRSLVFAAVSTQGGVPALSSAPAFLRFVP